ncbi:hypothetical protein [Streptomyces sp. RTd22]|uniref:hypothetical protein n=1 Tax=Streptomyces sp. RTd22 TaxID=1841249 RepID=UPI0007C5227A|nr:hypothetical protein [Streptomyces sp. RTd22]
MHTTGETASDRGAPADRDEQFAVGTELAGTSTDRRRWTRVITAVRDTYGGPLTCAPATSA